MRDESLHREIAPPLRGSGKGKFNYFFGEEEYGKRTGQRKKMPKKKEARQKIKGKINFKRVNKYRQK